MPINVRKLTKKERFDNALKESEKKITDSRKKYQDQNKKQQSVRIGSKSDIADKNEGKGFFSKIGSLFTASKKKRPEDKKSPYQILQEKKKAKLNSDVGKQPSRIQDKKGNIPFAAAGNSENRKYNKNPEVPKSRPKKVLKKTFQEPDSFPKSKVKQGPPQGIAKKTPLKKKSKSNISGSSSYDADFTEKGLKERGLDPKASMSKENYAKTSTSKNKKNAKGIDFGAKKKKKETPMYEYGGGKIKMAKGYSAGGKIFTGR
jgi:hypothetical protein